MRVISQTLADALEASTVVPRDMVSVFARRRDDQTVVAEHLWSDAEDAVITVRDPETGGSVSRTYRGAGQLVQTGVVNRTASLTVEGVDIQMSSVSADVDRIFREHEIRYTAVQMHRGWLDPESGALIGVPEPEFVGYVDNVQQQTPAENGSGVVILTCKTHSQEFTRSSPATRSDSYQKLRNPLDTFRKYVASVGQREFRWGQK